MTFLMLTISNYSKQFEIIDNRGQEPKSTKKEEAETKKT